MFAADAPMLSLHAETRVFGATYFRLFACFLPQRSRLGRRAPQYVCMLSVGRCRALDSFSHTQMLKAFQDAVELKRTEVCCLRSCASTRSQCQLLVVVRGMKGVMVLALVVVIKISVAGAAGGAGIGLVGAAVAL